MTRGAFIHLPARLRHGHPEFVHVSRDRRGIVFRLLFRRQSRQIGRRKRPHQRDVQLKTLVELQNAPLLDRAFLFRRVDGGRGLLFKVADVRLQLLDGIGQTLAPGQVKDAPHFRAVDADDGHLERSLRSRHHFQQPLHGGNSLPVGRLGRFGVDRQRPQRIAGQRVQRLDPAHVGDGQLAKAHQVHLLWF
jgi:hypothetical protein